MQNATAVPYGSHEFRSIETALSQLWQTLTGMKPEPSAHLIAATSSLTLVRFLSLIEEQLGQVIPLQVAVELPTIRNLASFIYLQNTWAGSLDPRMRQRDDSKQRPLLARVRPEGSHPPLVFVPPLGGLFASTAANEALTLSLHLHPDQPFYVLQPPALAVSPDQIHPRRLLDVASQCSSEVAGIAGQGSLFLASFCSGACLALALADRLLQNGIRINHLMLIDPLVAPESLLEPQNEESTIQTMAFFAVHELGGSAAGMREEELRSQLGPLDWGKRWDYLTNELIKRAVIPAEARPEHLRALFEGKTANERVVAAVCKTSELPAYHGAATILQCESGAFASLQDVLRYYGKYLQGSLQTRLLPGDHHTLFRPPYLTTLASFIQEILASNSG